MCVCEREREREREGGREREETGVGKGRFRKWGKTKGRKKKRGLKWRKAYILQEGLLKL